MSNQATNTAKKKLTIGISADFEGFEVGCEVAGQQLDAVQWHFGDAGGGIRRRFGRDRRHRRLTRIWAVFGELYIYKINHF